MTFKMTFKPGDVVRLKSGGYAMTVGEVTDGKHSVGCFWHNEHGDYQTAYYMEAVLISAVAVEIATGNEVPVESAFDRALSSHHTETWRERRGL